MEMNSHQGGCLVTALARGDSVTDATHFYIIQYRLEKERKQIRRRRERREFEGERERRLRTLRLTRQVLFWTLSDVLFLFLRFCRSLNQAVPIHLADESQTRHPRWIGTAWFKSDKISKKKKKNITQYPI